MSHTAVSIRAINLESKYKNEEISQDFKHSYAAWFVRHLTAYNSEASSPSPKNAQTTLDKTLNNILQQHGESEYYSSISASVQCGNKAPVTSAVGTISLNGDEPINLNSLSQIGSITINHSL